MTSRTRMEPLSIIVAVDEECGFGKEGKIPWNFSEDMKHFKEVTSGGICIMGRKTYEDMLEMVNKRHKQRISNENKKAIAEYEAIDKIGKEPTKKKAELITEILPGRKSFVVTSDDKFNAPGAEVVPSIRDAIHSLSEDDKREVFVIGGRRMFIEALTWATTIYMTVIKGEPYECDVFFPFKPLKKDFTIVKGTQNADMYFVTYQRSASRYK